MQNHYTPKGKHLTMDNRRQEENESGHFNHLLLVS